MSKEEVIEGNKLIALFMGAKCVMEDHTKGNEDYLKQIGETEWLIETWSKPDGLLNNMFWGKHQLGNFEYHLSWDWLMPVWFKFKDLKVITKNEYEHSKFKEIISRSICFDNNIEKSFIHLINGIKWYNQNK